MATHYWHPDLLDGGPALLKASANLFTLTSGLPTTRDEALLPPRFGASSRKGVAQKAIDSDNFILSAAQPNGRALSMTGLTGITFQENLPATHFCLVDETRLLLAIEMPSPFSSPAGGNEKLTISISDFVLRFPVPRPHSMLSAIGAGGFAASAVTLALDAGASESFSGTGQAWLDLSPGSYDFVRGLTSAPSTDDPGFSGSAGARTSSEYFSFDGGDQFSYSASSNELWMNNLHRSGAVFTAICVAYFSGFSISPALCGTAGAGFGPGIRWGLTSAGRQIVQVGDGGTFAMSRTATNAITDSTFHFMACVVNEAAGAGGSFFYLDGAYDVTASGNTFDGNYSSPTTADAAFQMQVGAGGNNSGRLESGSRMLAFGMLPTAASPAQLNAIYRALKRW